MARRTDASTEELTVGPRHGAEAGGGRRAFEAYQGYAAPPGPGHVQDVLVEGRQAPPGRRPGPPRRGRRGLRRWLPSWRLVLATFLLGTAAVTGLFLYLYSTTTLPAANADTTFQSTIVYDAGGKEIGRFAAQNRVDVPLSKIPKQVQEAVLSAEDRTFYTNGGVSVTSLARAALNNVRGGETQGGSTITQQYVKVQYSSVTDRSYGRKLREFFVSLKVARDLSKDEILERYLNIIYFGHGCYGIEAASEYYFNRPVQKLTVGQAAWLAAVIKGPEYYTQPTPGAATAVHQRWDYVLDGMVTQKWLTASERAGAAYPKPRLQPTAKKAAAGDQSQYELDMVRDEATTRLNISESDLERNGYRIHTTFQPRLMGYAQDSINQVLGAHASWPSGTQVAIATVDAKTGALVSMYAGNGSRQQNAVRSDIVQAGSTFKPFGLVAALEGHRDDGDCSPKPPDGNSLSLKSRFDASSPQTFPGLELPVKNDEAGGSGYRDLVDATAESINTVYVGMNLKVGPEHTAQVARCAGLPASTSGLDGTALNVLGFSSPHPLDMAEAYATFAADGTRHDTFVIDRVMTADDRTVAKEVDPDHGAQQVFDKGVVADASYAMQAVVQNGTGQVVAQLGRPVAGKTGTTSKFLSAWFAGYTHQQYATVVALYRLKDEKPVPLEGWKGVSDVYGATFPAQLWTTYMGKVLQGTPAADFPDPSNGGNTYDAAPPSPTAEPTPEPTTSSPRPSPTATTRRTARPSPSTAQPSPTGEPTPTATEPTASPTDEPTPSLPAEPTRSPRPSRSPRQ